MLTPRANDVNRKDELERKKHNPVSFGRSEIPKVLSSSVVLGQSQFPDESVRLAELAALKNARLSVITKKELLVVAMSNLTNGKAKDKDTLTGVVDIATMELEAVEATLNALLDM